MNSQQTVGDFFSRGFPDYNWGITDFHLTCDELIGAYKGKSQTDSYKRIGYFAQRWYANQFMQDFGLAIPGYRAQILNCGMVAITTTLIALLNDRKVLPGAQVVLAKEVYPRVPNVYQRLGFKVVRVDSSDLRAISLAKGHAPKIIHLETIGNGFDLPVLDVEGLLSVCWRTEVTIIIDNTLATLELVNPFQTLNRLKQELGEPNFNLVYVESLSKYYRIDGCDSFTAGVVIAEDLLMDQVDQVMGDTGSYIPPASLQLMPASPQLAANEMIQELSSKAKMLVDWLRQQDWVKVIHYPRQPAGGVLFFQLEDSAKIRDFCDKLDLPKASSFGHDMATVFPYGLFFPEDLPGVIRLSLGVKEDTDSVIHKLDMAAQAVFK